jgi:hypothetical protein
MPISKGKMLLESTIALCLPFFCMFVLFNRFQNDMADLIFVEKIARWLTNCQVKIKTEVAESNAQSLKIVQYLGDLERMIIGCETPSLDAGVSF